MSNYQADWLLDDEGNAIDEENNSEGEESDISNDEGDEEQEGDDDMEQQHESYKDLNSMPPPSGLPKAFMSSHVDIDDQDGDDITLDGSILTANLPTKKELQVDHQSCLNLTTFQIRRARDADEDERFPDEVIDSPCFLTYSGRHSRGCCSTSPLRPLSSIAIISNFSLASQREFAAGLQSYLSI